MLRRSVAALAVFLATASLARAAEPLKSDERNIAGKFDNGLQYIIRPHARPPGRVWFYLHIKTGALNETEPQNGLAHFIEHMAFNGSKNFKAGELIPLLNSLGMQFGVHTNAHTSYTETVYKLQMNDSEPKTVDTALKIFADYADGLLFEEKEIDEERGVIIEEWRSRKSPAERIQKQAIKKLFPESRLVTHDIIGTDTNVRAVTRDQFLDYWNTWYRPEHMTLIIVGDIKPDKVIEPAKKYLGSFQARGPAREKLKANLAPSDTNRAFVLTDAEQVGGEVEMLAIGAGREPVTTYERFRQETVEGIGELIVNRRLADLRQKGLAAYRSASVGSQDFLREATLFAGSASGEPADWNKMLDQVVAEIHRAVEHGFSQRDVDLAKAAILSGAERAVETESTMDAGAIVNTISRSIDEGVPVVSAATRLELTKRVLAEVTPALVHDAFKAGYAGKKYSYLLTIPEKKEGFTLPSTEDVLSAAASAWNNKVDAPTAEAVATSILEKQPTPGSIEKQVTDDALKITTVTFANGVVLHHRFVDYRKDQASVRLTLPGGRIEESSGNKGISSPASLPLVRPATSRLSSSQIRDLLTGKKVSLRGGIGLDAMSLVVAGSPKDLASGMELLHALLTDPKLEQTAFDEWKKNEIQAYEESLKTVEGALGRARDKTIFGNDPRFTEATPADLERLTAPAAEAWLKRIAATAPIEVAVVGEIDLESAVKLVGTYVGSLPKRERSFSDLDGLRKLDRPAGPLTATDTVETVTPKAIVFAGFVGADEKDVADVRKLTLVASILSERMIKRVREQERLVYSIGASHSPGRGLPGTGMLIAAAPTDPHNANKLADTILEMMREFAKSGPTEEELKVARLQLAKKLETDMKEPAFWLGQIGELEYRKKSLDIVKQLPDVYQTFTTSELQETAAKYVTDANTIRLVVSPNAPATRPAVPATQPIP